MALDPYQVLGVSKNADAAAIRKAYRTLAKKYHPDRNPEDKKAEEKFKEASAAFDILGDETKKAQFDRGEIDADGNQRAPFGGGNPFQGAYQANRGRHQANGNFEDIGDIFSDLFGGARQTGGFRQANHAMKGRDLKYRMEVSFLDAAKGVTKRVTMADGKTLDVKIAEGLRDGQTLRLRGQGGEGIGGGPNGDVYVDITVTPHRFFKLENDTIYLDVPITLSEAVKGEKIKIPTIHGDVAVKIPKGASSGTSLRLKNKGIRNPKTGKNGDQIAKLNIILPKKPDVELEKFIENWQRDKNLNPRAKLKNEP
ncbi:MAG: DnaJ C-terminal domain-containing protein [bacterium]